MADLEENKYYCMRKSFLFRPFHSFPAIGNEVFSCMGEGTAFSGPDSL